MSMYGKYPKIKNDKGEWVEQRPWPGTDFTKDKILTTQAPKDEVDINKIIKRMEKGLMVDTIEMDGRFDDVSEFGDLSDCIIKVQKANGLFMGLPAEVRSRFDNDPTKLVAFLEDDTNRKEAEDLGLVMPREAGSPATIPPATGEIPPLNGGKAL